MVRADRRQHRCRARERVGRSTITSFESPDWAAASIKIHTEVENLNDSGRIAETVSRRDVRREFWPFKTRAAVECRELIGAEPARLSASARRCAAGREAVRVSLDG